MSTPRLVVSVFADTMAELRAGRDAASVADLVELRLDGVRDLDVAAALAGRGRPVIVTCRPTWEGGRFVGPEDDRRRILAVARTQGADYIDVEWRAGFTQLVQDARGRGVVLSTHDFEGVPDDLEERYRVMRATGAEVVKVAVQTARLADQLALLGLGRRTTPDEPAALVGMGPAGVASRVLAARFGGCWTYAGGGTGLGQLSAKRMVEDFRFRAIGPETEVYGLVGAGVVDSPLPAMHNAGFQAVGRDACSVPLEAADAADFLSFADAIGLRGASVAAPFRSALRRAAAQVDPPAARAVTALRRDGGSWSGRDTAGICVLRALGTRLAVNGARAAVLGAGVTGRAVAAALGAAGARVTVWARDVGRAREAASPAGGTGRVLPPPAGSWDLLVNATPVGAFPHVDETLVAADEVRGGVVCDLASRGSETRLLADARTNGCETVTGLELLIEQTGLEIEWWTGRPVPREVLESVARRHLAEARAAVVSDPGLSRERCV